MLLEVLDKSGQRHARVLLLLHIGRADADHFVAHEQVHHALHLALLGVLHRHIRFLGRRVEQRGHDMLQVRHKVCAEALADPGPSVDDVLRLGVIALDNGGRHHLHHVVSIRRKLLLAHSQTDKTGALDGFGAHEPQVDLTAEPTPDQAPARARSGPP